MPRVRFTTNLEEDILKMAKDKAVEEGLDGANIVIEKALKFYFANSNVSVWERVCSGGWLRKLIIRPDILILENIRSRKSTSKYERAYYTNEQKLIKDGWKKVWKMNTGGKNGN